MTSKAAHKLHAVTVELLRSGPPHNQLLSPLTDYLALCGNHSAVSVRVPYEHAQYERRVDSLRYAGSAENNGRSFDIAAAARELGQMLSAIPGLSPGLAEAVASKCDMTHLELVLTPNELALLPFECMHVPDGAPGGYGQNLLLQSNAPVCMTRAVRGVSGEFVDWPLRPNILFAWAETASTGSVPYEDHLLALRRALSPWIRRFHGNDEKLKKEHNRAQVKQHLTVLPNATVSDIYDACSATQYTHVHILAHGVTPDGDGNIGLGLTNPSSKRRAEIVDGRSLANALRFRDPDDPQCTSLPSVVSIASCDSGKIKSLITHGASIAHELHNAGIPFVLASQFPLSKPGSVVMTEELYGRMLNAEDPRIALHYVRRRLYSRFSQYHDWASIVAYAALPSDLESQLAHNQFLVARQRINGVLDEADALIDATPGALESFSTQKTEKTDGKTAGDKLMNKLSQLRRLEDELILRGSDAVESLGISASTEKRKAEILFWAAGLEKEGDPRQQEFHHRSVDALLKSRNLYQRAVQRDMTRHWVVVQYLCLTRVLMATGRVDETFPVEHWIAAKVAADAALDQVGALDQSWAHGSLAELYLLQLLAPVPFHSPDEPPAQDAADQVLLHVKKMLELSTHDSFELYSTRRQFARYIDWWSMLRDGPFPIDIHAVVHQVMDLLPERSPG